MRASEPRRITGRLKASPLRRVDWKSDPPRAPREGEEEPPKTPLRFEPVK
jgi:hypothetical protein